MRSPAAAAAAVAALLACAACWTERAPRPPRLSSTPVPGTLWATPAQPWRTHVHPFQVAAAGPTAMLASGAGWLGWFDLGRGALVRERWLKGVTVHHLLALPDGRWLLVGKSGKRGIAATIDPATLEPKTVVTGAERKDGPAPLPAGRAVVLDGGIAIVGEGLPLAIYDPATWQVRRVIDPRLGWSQAAGGGKTLYAVLGRDLMRVDLAAGASTKLDAGGYIDATEAHLVTRVYKDRQWVYAVDTGGAKTHLGGGDPGVALDPARGRIAIRDRARVHVHDLTDGKRLGSYELGESGYDSHHVMAFAGDRLLVAISTVLRVIDLTTGAITPAGDPPYAHGTLAVSAAGEVQYVGTHALRLAGGEVVASARITRGEAAVGDPHEVTRYGVYPRADAEDVGQVSTFRLGARGPVDGWRVKDYVSGMWLGRTGRAVIDTHGIQAQRALFLGSGASLERLVAINYDANVLDVDVDGGHALVSVEGTAHLVRFRDGAVVHRLPHPSCDPYVLAELERGGDRLYLMEGHDLVVYRRSTGALVGAARFEGLSDTAVFVPGRDELLLTTRDAIVLWDPRTGAARRLGGVAGIVEAAASPRGDRAALLFRTGRIALVDLDALRAAMAPGRAPASGTAVPTAPCASGDPFELDPTHAEEPGDLLDP